MKTIQLLRVLNEKEQKRLEKTLREKKRVELSKLYKKLKTVSIHETPEKEVLFKAVFSEKYTKEKDFLLRNELRLLNNELIQILSSNPQESILAEIQRETTYLTNLLERKAFEVYENEYRRALKSAKENWPKHYLISLVEQHASYIRKNKEATLSNYQELDDLQEELINLSRTNFAEEYTRIWQVKSFTGRVRKALDPSSEISKLETTTFNWADHNWMNELVAFRIQMIESAQFRGKEKIEKLLEAEKLIAQIDHRDFSAIEAKVALYATIALEYFLAGESELSLDFHRKIMDLEIQIPPDDFVVHAFNYATTLMRLKDFQTATKVLANYESTYLSNDRLHDRYLCMRTLTHLYINEPDAAQKLLPEGWKNSGTDHYYYFRSLQIMIFISEKRWLIAQEEIENFLETMDYRKFDDDYVALARFFRQLIRIEMAESANTPKSLNSELKQLKEAMSKMRNENPRLHNAMLYDWLALQIENRLNTL